jgi:hypothetical protein
MVAARRRSFSGGVWIRKRKTVTSSVSALDRKDVPVGRRSTTLGASKAKNSIVWDEERCRVVYKPGQSTALSSSGNNDDGSDGDVDGCWGEDDPVENAVPLISSDYMADLSFPNTTITTKRRGGRSYALRKRVSPHLSDKDLDSLSTSCASKRAKEYVLDGKDNDSNGNDSKAADNISCKDYAEECVPHQETEFKQKAQTCPPMTELSIFDGEEAEKTISTEPEFHQPSSKTSLEKASAFFKCLDTKRHQLTLDHTNAPVHAGNACIRTCRRSTVVSDSSPSDRQGYNEYVTGCREWGVEPLPMQIMLQCVEFRRPTGIYDGFLDD